MNVSCFKAGKLVQRFQYKSFDPKLMHTQSLIGND